jgi:hypothetical protein
MPSPTTDRLTDQECVAMLSRSTLAAVGDLVAEALLPQRCIVCDRFGAALETKFRGVTKLIEPLAGAAARAVPLHWRIDAVVPVPLHRARERRRGFNQAESVACAACSRWSAKHPSPC